MGHDIYLVRYQVDAPRAELLAAVTDIATADCSVGAYVRYVSRAPDAYKMHINQLTWEQDEPQDGDGSEGGDWEEGDTLPDASAAAYSSSAAALAGSNVPDVFNAQLAALEFVCSTHEGRAAFQAAVLAATDAALATFSSPAPSPAASAAASTHQPVALTTGQRFWCVKEAIYTTMYERLCNAAVEAGLSVADVAAMRAWALPQLDEEYRKWVERLDLRAVLLENRCARACEGSVRACVRDSMSWCVDVNECVPQFGAPLPSLTPSPTPYRHPPPCSSTASAHVVPWSQTRLRRVASTRW